jgi:hypothetical protein
VGSSPEQPVRRASDSGGAAVQHVRVDHRGAHIAVAQQFLNRADVVAVFEEVRRERMAERVTRRADEAHLAGSREVGLQLEEGEQPREVGTPGLGGVAGRSARRTR